MAAHDEGVTYAAVFPLLSTRALEEAFEYVVPPGLTPGVRRGSLVAVPLGRSTVLGVVLGLSSVAGHAGRHAPVGSAVALPPIPGELLDVAERVRDHYLTSYGAALGLVTPPAAALRLQRGYELTDEGRAALARAEPGSELLAAVEGGAAALRGRRPALDRLRRRGWLATTYRLRVTRERGGSRLISRGPAPAKGLGARQRAAVTLLERRRQIDERLLLERTGLTRQGLGALLERGVAAAVEEAAAHPARHTSAAYEAEPVPVLLAEQEAAVGTIMAAVGRGEEVLLHGVTGSGKTEVYLRAAETVLNGGRSVLLLVPEIGLTAQTVARLQARFPGERLAVLHSGLSAGERLAAYDDAASGRARLVIGARSAVFAPVEHLGLIVIDEEHDASYKQDGEPRYDARTIARWRASASGAALVLGSATPSVEAFARVARHADLPGRVDGSAPPPLEVVDMRDHHAVLSPQLAAALTATVDAGEKAILFLNRRGYASLLACGHCGHTWTCPRCDVSLALFAHGRRLRCRVCGYALPVPPSCPECASLELRRFGYGTESLEREVAGLMPGVELLRLDSDVAASFARLRAVLDRFAAPGPRVLVGTQMIAKGHHFPDVTLVGVVNADLTLHFPDFRAEERTFAMLIQVGGRSGRGPRGGRVIVQTLDPQARPIALAASGEHERFYADEVARRTALGYPPATTLIAVELSAGRPEQAVAAGHLVRGFLDGGLRAGEQVVGPGPLSRERSRYLARLVIKTSDIGETIGALRALRQRRGAELTRQGVRLVVDVEPQWL